MSSRFRRAGSAHFDMPKGLVQSGGGRGPLSERPLAGGPSRSNEGPSEEDPGAARRHRLDALAGALLGFGMARREARPAAAHGSGDALSVDPVVLAPQLLCAVVHMLVWDS